MLSLLDFMRDTLGSPPAVADYLGYTPRQLRNIRTKLRKGGKLHVKLELHILRQTIQLKEAIRQAKSAKKRKGQ
jgi:ribosomal protein L10